MKRYDTPHKIAQLLSEYSPKKITSLLEPAVGKGQLLEPILFPYRSSIRNVHCVDIDSDVLLYVNNKFDCLYRDKLKVFNENFLDWCDERTDRYDCIVMNPPFAGKKNDLIKITHKQESAINKQYKYVSIEIAFILKACELLKSSGIILAVVPQSVVASLSCAWFRKHLLMNGEIKYVHELPEKYFDGFDSKVYLLVYKKLSNKNNISLISNDLNKQNKIVINKSNLSLNYRLDYSYYSHINLLESCYFENTILQLDELKNFCDIYRSNKTIGLEKRLLLHTTNYRRGFWDVTNAKCHKSSKDKIFSDLTLVNSNDIVVKRVGRNCSSTFSILIADKAVYCTDCVLVIRPHKKSFILDLLFSIRTIYASSIGSGVLERGNGARYLTKIDLESLIICVNLSSVFKDQFKRYQKAVDHRNYNDMIIIENECRNMLIFNSTNIFNDHANKTYSTNIKNSN